MLRVKAPRGKGKTLSGLQFVNCYVYALINMKRPGGFSVKAIAFPLLVGGIIVTGFILRDSIFNLFADRFVLRAWVEKTGLLAPLAFVGIQLIQVLIFIIPGEMTQTAGGFLFGFFNGVFLSVIGIALGSALNYYVGKILGRPFVLAVLGEEKLQKAQEIISNKAVGTGYFLLFLIPGIPKDVLCYVAGMSKAPLNTFLVASMTARLPGILGSSLIGQTAYSGQTGVAITILICAVALLLSGLVWRKALEDLLLRLRIRFGKK